jgi:arabinose-5-phosphate isomerase
MDSARQALARARATLRHEKEAVARVGKALGSNFIEAVNILAARRGRIIITGVGKSGFIGMKMSATLTSLGHTSLFLHPVEALHGDTGAVSKGDVLIALSFSGESAEVIRITRYLKRLFQISAVAITGVRDSTVAQLTDVVLVVPVREEGCPIGLAPMASATATLVVGDLLASALTSPANFNRKHFARLHPGGNLGLSIVRVGDVMAKGTKRPMIADDAPFGQALMEMSRKGLGVVGVVNARKQLVGVITDGDIRRILIKHDDPKQVKTKNLMTRSPRSVFENDSLKEALALMERHKVTNLFVIDAKKEYRGLIHIHDIVELV